MQYSHRTRVFQRLVLTAQNPTNVSLYNDKFGKFLNEGCKSKLRLLHAPSTQVLVDSPVTCRSDDSDASTLMGSSLLQCTDLSHTQPFFTSASVADQNDQKIESVNHEDDLLELGTPQAIKAICADHRRGLLVFEVGQSHSFARIDMTEQCFEQLSRSLQIFGAVKDAVLYIGCRGMEVEIAPPRPRINWVLDEVDHCIRGSEIVYGLRYVELNGRSDSKPWSLRQFVVYNKTTYRMNISNWLFVSIPSALRDRLAVYLKANSDGLDCHPFELHALIVSVTLPMWRPYLIELTRSAEQIRQKICMANINGHAACKLTEDMLHILKNLEDDVLDVALAVTSMRDTIDTLQTLYGALRHLETPDISNLNGNAPDLTATVLYEKSRDAQILIEQANMLVAKLRSSSRTVSSFLGLENGHALRNLTLEAREESKSMAELTIIANGDARAVKALAVVTVIYLPVTVVLNFFSASFIEMSGGTMHFANRWWLFVVVGIPLTILTLALWLLWVNHARVSRHKRCCLPSSRQFFSALTRRTDDDLGKIG